VRTTGFCWQSNHCYVHPPITIPSGYSPVQTFIVPRANGVDVATKFPLSQLWWEKHSEIKVFDGNDGSS